MRFIDSEQYSFMKFVNAADNLHAFPSTAIQVSSDRRAVLFFPVVEAPLVSPLAPDAELLFVAELDWPAAPQPSVAPVSPGAAWEMEPAEVQEVSQA